MVWQFQLRDHILWLITFRSSLMCENVQGDCDTVIVWPFVTAIFALHHKLRRGQDCTVHSVNWALL